MTQREILLLAEMVDASERAQLLVRGHDADAFAVDRQRRDALLWNFTVLGEAAAQLSAEFKAEHPEVDWARPSQLRNRIEHGYWSVDLEILHTTATVELPEYSEKLRGILGSFPAEP